MTAWIILSPHLDDAALSLGGLIWELAQAGQTPEVWTLCAGDPPDGPLSPFAQSLHNRWETGPAAAAARRSEDRLSCAELGAAARHLDLPDCIYRRGPDGAALYASDEAIMGPVHPAEAALAAALAAQIQAGLPPGAQLAGPLALGGHVDHRLARAALELTGRPVWYYADYPYVLQHAAGLPAAADPAWQRQVFAVSAAGLAAWQRSVAAHTSQISTFWANLAQMEAAMARYWQPEGGCTLWQQRILE